MRQRYRSYELPAEVDARKVIEEMRRPEAGNRCFLIQLIGIVYPDLQDELYASIIYGWSYEAIERKTGRTIPLEKGSFYGYRRKVISCYYQRTHKEEGLK